MCAYETLAGAYDGLTRDIDYAGILDFLETVLRREDRHPKKMYLTVLYPTVLYFTVVNNSVL